jgi:hypothetical protein
MTEVSRIRAARRRLAAIGCALTLAGCDGAPLPVITSGPDAADPRTAGRAATYTPVTAGTVHHQPVEPKSWRDMNERVAPRAGGSP